MTVHLLAPGALLIAALAGPATPPMPAAARPGIDALQAQLAQTAVAAPAGVTAPAPPADLAALVEALDQKVSVLERRLELDQAHRAETGRTAPAVAASGDGFVITSADESFQLKLRGLVQSDGRFYGEDARRLAATDSFVLRRVRPMLDVTMFSVFDARLVPDFGEGKTVVQDAYIDARLRPALRIRAGKMKAPLGLERLTSAGDLLFTERALPTAVAPNRDIGVMVQGDVLRNRLLYQAGLFNGVIDGASADADDGGGKDVVARVFVTPFRGRGSDRLENLGVGIAGSRGNAEGTLAGSGLATYKTAGQQTFFRYRLGTTLDAITLADGNRTRVSAQASYYTGRLSVVAEQVRSTQDLRRGSDAAAIGTTAWQLAGSWVLTGELATGRSVRPRHPFDAARNTWGAVELAARVNALRVDNEAFPRFADPAVSARRASGWAAGVNWYLNRAVKVVVDYERTAFSGGAAAGADRPTEHDVFTRVQFAF